MPELARVLIVDSDQTVRSRLFTALLDLAVYSDTAAGAPEAIEHFSAREYGLVILDLRVTDAESVLQAVQGVPRDRRPMVIGTGERDMAQELDADLIQIVIRKPMAVRQLAEVVRSCLEAAPRWRHAPESQSDEATL